MGESSALQAPRVKAPPSPSAFPFCRADPPPHFVRPYSGILYGQELQLDASCGAPTLLDRAHLEQGVQSFHAPVDAAHVVELPVQEIPQLLLGLLLDPPGLRVRLVQCLYEHSRHVAHLGGELEEVDGFGSRLGGRGSLDLDLVVTMLDRTEALAKPSSNALEKSEAVPFKGALIGNEHRLRAAY